MKVFQKKGRIFSTKNESRGLLRFVDVRRNFKGKFQERQNLEATAQSLFRSFSTVHFWIGPNHWSF